MSVTAHLALGPSVPSTPLQLVASEIPLTRHQSGGRLSVRARSVLGDLHHEYLLLAALA